MNRDRKKLKMSFDPKTIEHLGLKMYSQLPNAVAELVANAYDACAKIVKIKLLDAGEKVIIVEDDGIGMSYEEVNSKFLRIGRNRRDEVGEKSPCGRQPTGRKGLGKLALFGIGERIEISTSKDGRKTVFALDWNELVGTSGGNDYFPQHSEGTAAVGEKGTTVTLTILKRKTEFDADLLAESLAKLFDFDERNFEIILLHNDEKIIKVDSALKYKNITAQFSWQLPKFSTGSEFVYEHKNEIFGEIITTEKPLKPGLRGVSLYARGRLVNTADFFGAVDSSHFYSYTTGWLDIDFIDDWEEDVISTNRQSLNWENEKTEGLRIFLRKIIDEIHKEWRIKRKESKEKDLGEKAKIDIKRWYGTLPPEVEVTVSRLVSKMVDDSELSDSETSSVVKAIHELVPEYPLYHWRHIHPEIQRASKSGYEKQDYYHAFIEAAKRYLNKIRELSGSTDTDHGMVGGVFGKNKVIQVAKGYLKSDGMSFNVSTLENIEEGQKFLSMGIVVGGRNPVSHEEVKELRLSKLFSEKDCLDGLSLLSHLMNGVENYERNV